MRARLAYAASFLVLFGFQLTPSLAHDGHDHDEPAQAASQAAPRGEAVSGDMQLVAVLRDGVVTVYLDRLSNNEPVTDAEIEVLTPSGTQKAERGAGGTYRIPAKWTNASDHTDLIFTVTRAGNSEVLPVTIAGTTARAEKPEAEPAARWMLALAGFAIAFIAFIAGAVTIVRSPRLARRYLGAVVLVMLAVLASAQAHEANNDNHSPAPSAQDVSQRLPDGTIFVPKAVQRLLAIRTGAAKDGEYARTVELPGRVIPDANASGYVQSTLAGRLLPPPDGFPALGSRVTKGQVLAYVEPPIQAIDVSDMRQKEGELLQQIAIVERRVARFEKLVESNAIPRTQLEDARTELEGLRGRRAQLEKIRREPEVLVAPVSGVIAEANTVAGQLAQPSTVVFQIIDPARLWVEALSFDAIAGIGEASARTESGRSLKLLFRGSAAALRNQSIAVQFAIDGSTADVWAGQFVTVFASLPGKRHGIRVPRAAVVRAANGQQVIFEHVSAERFAPKLVKIEPLDADNVLVMDGLKDGARIAVRGAELLDQVR